MDTVSIDPRTLYSRLGAAASPLLLDVRRAPAFVADDRMIVATQRCEDPGAFTQAFPPRPLVAYCVHGHEVSQEAARTLAMAGHEAAYLEGGIEAWREAGLPTIRRRAEWNVPGGSRWITRERPKIDRVACPWLVRRFIDPGARFDYVAPEHVIEQAGVRGAVPYDVPGVQVTHRGERCSFDALLVDFDLHDPALDLLATIVRGADTNRLDLAPQSAGLLAASLGLSRQHADDHAMLEQAMSLYDGLYAWCRDVSTGTRESHAWVPAQ